jgi:hypothetical protein
LSNLVLKVMQTTRAPLTFRRLKEEIRNSSASEPEVGRLRRALRFLRNSGEIMRLDPIQAYVALHPDRRREKALFCEAVPDAGPTPGASACGRECTAKPSAGHLDSGRQGIAKDRNSFAECIRKT